MAKPTVTLAKTAGFCFGVARAVKMCEELADYGARAVTLGPIIHNRQTVVNLERRGVAAAGSLEGLLPDTVVVIRSHGVPPEVFGEIEARGLTARDATCPYVKAIQDIAGRAFADGRTVLIAGDADHPEIVGIAGCCRGRFFVFESLSELREKIFPKTAGQPVLMVAQTTFNLVQYKDCVEAARAFYPDLEVRYTVCDATVQRQSEAGRLGADCDVCVVIGGKNSSNTRKLYDICSENAVTYLVESRDELTASMFEGVGVIGVTAGASTPDQVIEEVLKRMTEILNENNGAVEETGGNALPDTESAVLAEDGVGEAAAEAAAESSGAPAETDISAGAGGESSEAAGESDAADESAEAPAEEEFNFETALEDSLRSVRRNQRVFGVVTQIRPNEVVVDIGSKHTGIIPAEELSDDSSRKPEDVVKVGERLNLLVIATNDQEGITTLSKKRLDSSEGMEFLISASENGDVLDAFVVELVNKGLIAIYKGVRIFVPASQATLRHGENYDNLNRTNVRLKILEVNPARRRVIGSLRAVLQEELNKKRDVFWAEVEEGKEYTGQIKSLTSYGAFVDLGGVDGMIHVSELSWQRVRNPADVVSVGEEITVYVREIDRERKRISLGYRKEEDNPWKVFEADYTVGDIFEAKVVSLTKFGAFVRIMSGVDGLVHISEICPEHIEKASEILSVGDDVTVKLIRVDPEKRRVSLTMVFDGAPVLERKPRREESENRGKNAAPAEAAETVKVTETEGTDELPGAETESSDANPGPEVQSADEAVETAAADEVPAEE